MPTAYLDESERAYAGRSIYVVAATIVIAPADADHPRREMRALLPSGRAKVHWYSAFREDRQEVIGSIAGFDLMNIAVHHDLLTGDAAERSRRICLTRMIYELQGYGVERAILEARQATQDRRDIELFRSSVLPAGLRRIRASHQPGAAEPLLWIPDAVCGAVGEGLLYNDWSYCETLGARHHRVSTSA